MTNRTPPARLTRRQREKLVATLRARGIADERVLAAVGAVQRHRLMDDGFQQRAYLDEALPIGLAQTISQPHTVARMTELLAPRPGDRVLEVGTGSGYQAAILSELGARVFSVERHADLLRRTAGRLDALGYKVRTRAGDGTYGWPGYAPFDGIVVTAGGPTVHAELVDQLRAPKDGRPDARLVIPVGPPEAQVLHRVTRTAGGDVTETFDGVVFVPLVRG